MGGTNKQSGKPKHVLVINDTEEILELFQLILHEEAGHEVTITSFQPRMVEFVKEIKPDLIISDHVFGEEKVGFQFLQRLKMDRETAGIPVIICSGAVKELKEIEGYWSRRTWAFFTNRSTLTNCSTWFA